MLEGHRGKGCTAWEAGLARRARARSLGQRSMTRGPERTVRLWRRAPRPHPAWRSGATRACQPRPKPTQRGVQPVQSLAQRHKRGQLSEQAPSGRDIPGFDQVFTISDALRSVALLLAAYEARRVRYTMIGKTLKHISGYVSSRKCMLPRATSMSERVPAKRLQRVH